MDFFTAPPMRYPHTHQPSDQGSARDPTDVCQAASLALLQRTAAYLATTPGGLRVSRGWPGRLQAVLGSVNASSVPSKTISSQHPS